MTQRNASPGLEAGERIADKYAIELRIGEGGMGIIYAATNVLTGKKVAVKWMHPRSAENEDAVARFLREARAAGSIDHPNVVNIFDVGRHDGSPFLVMELLRGKPLSEIFEEAPLQADVLADILVPAMRGIAAAHSHGIVHRDLKPENIFVCHDAKGRRRDAKVLDFGISKAFDSHSDLASVTQTGAVIGTPAYMSPEQIRGESNIDAQSDVYALGVILYEGLTGELPFQATLFTALAVEIATGNVRRPRELVPSIDPELDAIVMRAMSRDRAQRYEDVPELARELERFGRVRFDEGISERPPPPRLDARRERETAPTMPVGELREAIEPAGEATVSGESPVPAGEPTVSGHGPVEVAAPSQPTPAPTSASTSAAWAEVEQRSRPRWPILAAGAVVAIVALSIAAVVLWPDPPPPEPLEVAEPSEEPAPVVEDPQPPPEPIEVAEEVAPEPQVEAPEEIAPQGVEPPAEPARTPRVRPRGETARTERAQSTESSPQRTEAREAQGESARGRGVRTGGVSVDEF
jgi:serine/threonine protein kinase